MRDHLVKEQENIWHCLYCNKELSAKTWNSIWEGEFHYKVTHCECGRKHRVKVDFFGSGHDDWDKQVNLVFDKDGRIKIENKKKEEIEDKIREELARLDHT